VTNKEKMMQYLKGNRDWRQMRDASGHYSDFTHKKLALRVMEYHTVYCVWRVVYDRPNDTESHWGWRIEDLEIRETLHRSVNVTVPLDVFMMEVHVIKLLESVIK
jgi:hypothetical protein